MKKVKNLSQARSARNLRTRPTTTSDSFKRIVPSRASRNIPQGHLVSAMRDINHIEWEPWEQTVTDMQRAIDRERLRENNRYYNALNKAHEMVREVRLREEELQTNNEEMEATNEELQATNEEMEASNEELEATNEELQATTEELENTNAYRQTLMDSMMDILMTTNTKGVITDVNRATEKISGFGRDELIGAPFKAFFTEPEHALAGIKEAQEKTALSNYDLIMVTKDGREVPLNYNAVALKGRRGRVSGVLGTARDMTEFRRIREQLRLTEERNQSLMAAIQDAEKRDNP